MRTAFTLTKQKLQVTRNELICCIYIHSSAYIFCYSNLLRHQRTLHIVACGRNGTGCPIICLGLLLIKVALATSRIPLPVPGTTLFALHMLQVLYVFE